MDALALPISPEIIYLYHSIDRRLYAILAMELCFDPLRALGIMAFWISLERIGFRNTVAKILSLPTPVITRLAEEAISCLEYIEDNRLSSFSKAIILETRQVINEKLSLQFLFEKLPEIRHYFAQVTSEVCHLALMDIMREAQERNALLMALRLSGEVQPDGRTLFVTFSRGYPVTEQEMHDFLVRNYGDYVEALHMQEVKSGEQVLFARVVFHSLSMLDYILSGKEKIKFVINGKHVCARKFMPKAKK